MGEFPPAVPQQIEHARVRIAALEEALLDTQSALEHTEAQLHTARRERDLYQRKLREVLTIAQGV